MSLRTKLLLAQLPLALVLALLGAIALRALSDLGRTSQRILRENYRSVLAAQRMNEALQRSDLASFEAELAVQSANVTEPGEAEATARLQALWQEYRGSTVPAARFAQLKEATGRILQINQDAMVRKSEEARLQGERLRNTLFAATVAALVLGLLASVALTTRALQPLSVLSAAVRKLGEGDLEARAQLGGGDEIATVGRELDGMADRLRAYRQSSLGELLQAQQTSQAAIDSLPDPVLVLGVDGALLTANESAERDLRLQAGDHPLALLDAEVRAAVERVGAHVISGKGPYLPRGLEEAVRVGDRKLLPRATPLHAERGKIAGATVVLQDVTRLVRFDELKNDLVATVAHEFRTPLTSLRMAIDLVSQAQVGPITAKQADLLAAAREDCERLQGIVDDLLDLSRIEAGKVEVQPVSASSKALVEAAVASRAAAAREAGVEVSAQLPPAPPKVLADVERIALVLDNLIGNAVRHSPRGSGVLVRAEALAGEMKFEVIDRGGGIAPEYRTRIFEKFFRVPGTRGDGIGLGLYISREIVRAHGGAMGVETAPGQGSRFWFTLKAA